MLQLQYDWIKTMLPFKSVCQCLCHYLYTQLCLCWTNSSHWYVKLTHECSRSATSLKPLTGEVKHIDHLVTIRRAAGKPWDLAFTPMPMNMNHPPKHCCRPGTTSHSSWAGSAPLARQCFLQRCKKYSAIARGTWQRAQGINLASKFLRSRSNWASVGCTWTNLIYEGPS